MHARRSAWRWCSCGNADGVGKLEVLVADVGEVRRESRTCACMRISVGDQPQPPGTQVPTTLLNTPSPLSNPSLIRLLMPHVLGLGGECSVACLWVY